VVCCICFLGWWSMNKFVIFFVVFHVIMCGEKLATTTFAEAELFFIHWKCVVFSRSHNLSLKKIEKTWKKVGKNNLCSGPRLIFLSPHFSPESALLQIISSLVRGCPPTRVIIINSLSRQQLLQICRRGDFGKIATLRLGSSSSIGARGAWVLHGFYMISNKLNCEISSIFGRSDGWGVL